MAPRIPTDRGCEMAVIFCRKAKMSDTFRRIDRPGHRPEQQPADQRFLRCSIQACKNLLNLRRGVEIEALTGVEIALLTIYDMCKALDRSMEMNGIRLCQKSGGKSGDYRN